MEQQLYHYQFARHIYKSIQGIEWRKAWQYYCDPKIAGHPDSDPIEHAGIVLRGLRRRGTRYSKMKTE
jgi:hypothetical protein